MATTTDISPYLQRPVRKLEEAIAEVEQQRLNPPSAISPSKPDDPPSSDAATNKEAI